MPSCSSSIGSEDGERIAEDLRVSIRTAEELGTGSLRIQLQTEDEEGSHDVSEGNGGHGSSWDLVTEVDRVNIVRGYAAVVRVCCAWVNERLATDQCLHGEIGSGQAADRHLCGSPRKARKEREMSVLFLDPGTACAAGLLKKNALRCYTAAERWAPVSAASLQFTTLQDFCQI